MTTRPARIAFCLAAAAAAACSTESPIATSVAAIVDNEERNALDVLFVVDQSYSMLDEQATLGARAREALFEAIPQHAGRRPDLHIGVITTSVYEDLGGFCPGPGGARDGALVNRGCNRDGAAFLSDVRAADGTRAQNYDDFDDAFACAVNVGPDGCGVERPFDALSLALTRPDNADFFRADADLLVIFITDEDDCSLAGSSYQELLDVPSPGFACQHATITCNEDLLGTGVKTDCALAEDSPLIAPQVVMDTLTAFKGGPARVALTVISGGTDSVEVVASHDGDLWASACTTSATDATIGASPAFRMAAFASALPGRSESHSICAPLESALHKTAALAGDALARRGCLRGAFATQAEPRCKAMEVRPDGVEQEVTMHLDRDARCGTEHDLRAVIDATALAPGGHVEVRCAAADAR